MTVSWLTLERYALGDLPPGEVARVEAALAADPELRRRLEAIRADDRAVPALPLVLPEAAPAAAVDASTPRTDGPVVPLRPRRWWAAAGLALALAAGALVVVGLPAGGPPTAPARVAWKGGELALSLDRLREGRVRLGAETWREGDTIQARLTCPPGLREVGVRAWQDEALVWEAEPVPVDCGNGRVVPGAIALAGTGEVTVCVVVDDEGEVCAALEEE